MSGLYVPSLSVAIAKADVGYHEGYNNRNKYSYWQYGDYYQPWCASACSKWAYDAGFRFAPSTFGEKGENNVTMFQRWAERRGVWRSRTTVAHPGWFVNLNFEKINQHIEMVIADAGGPTVATIGGNTGNAVLYRTRYRRDINGFIAIDQAGQTKPGAVSLTPKEIKIMGMRTACIVPGSKKQTADGPWKAHYPMVGAYLTADGKWELRGMNGAKLGTQNASGYGISFCKLGKLNAPIVSVEPVLKKDGTWTGEIVGLAEDGGTFSAGQVTVHYL